MTKYLLSMHSVEGEARDPMTEEDMRQFMERGIVGSTSLLGGVD